MLKLNALMNSEIQEIAEIAGRFYIGNHRGRAFIMRMAAGLQASAETRSRFEKNGVHIPPFLIASITAVCNLHCAGCYARATGECSEDAMRDEMSAEDWRRVFIEASDIGVSFILLAGGEPLLRRDILDTAARFENIFFPVFTNGTMVDADALALFDSHRNLIPVLSIEGDKAQTDGRRGEGVSETVWKTADSFREKGILFGVSITVTSENRQAVTNGGFVRELHGWGCGLIFYVEYVPAEAGTEHLILSDGELLELQASIDALREDKHNRGMIIVSFPGDEDALGGCLAAGRGFFHINANGGAEPCPFSPYSEMNLKNQSILKVLQSPFFEKARAIGAAEAMSRKGGCALFSRASEVENAAKGDKLYAK
jgi:MoaA/NifB/PqqE/SkfB family radical SAM enzyme